MKTAALIAAARAAIAKTYPSSTDLILASVDSYGQRRLYPITAAADTIAALVGAKTIEERHLPLAERLGLSVLVVPASEAIRDAATALVFARADRAPDHQVGQAFREDGRDAEARAGARAMLGAIGETLPPPPPFIKIGQAFTDSDLADLIGPTE
jgi:hypothetical protein